MYNEDRKKEFLSVSKRGYAYGESIFNSTKSAEIEADKDVCEMTLEELQPIVNERFGLRARSNRNAILFLQSYVQWCEENGYDTSKDVYVLKISTEEKIRKEMVGSPKHLESVLDQAFDKVSELTVDCLSRAFLWFAFSGLSEEEAINLRVQDINFKTMTIDVGGQSFEIYRESLSALQEVCNSTVFRYYNRNYAKELQGQYRKRHESDWVFRSIRSAHMSLSSVKTSIFRKLQESNVEIHYSSVRLSGLFYRTYEMERIGIEPNFDSYVMEQASKKDRGMKPPMLASRFYDNRKYLIIDYQNWKNIFT